MKKEQKQISLLPVKTGKRSKKHPQCNADGRYKPRCSADAFQNGLCYQHQPTTKQERKKYTP